MPTNPIFLVTGGMGCLGAWTLAHLVRAGRRAVSFDLSANRARLDQLLSPAEQAAITFVQGDLTDPAQVAAAVRDHAVDHIIHLAALQVPFCKADPVAGAQVNVTGTVNVFEAARHAGIRHLAYASSIAVYGPPDRYPPGLVAHDAPFDPRTLYGVYKVADEGLARIYWQDYGVGSVALRPYTVYGVGRDQGLTSEPTQALRAVAAGQPYHISFGGTMQLQWASDVAQQFIDAAQMPPSGARAFNLGGEPVTLAAFVALVGRIRPNAALTVGDARLPFPAGFDDSALRAYAPRVYATPLADGIRHTLDHFTP